MADTTNELMEFATCSDRGLVRECNEDSFFASAELGLWVVADGMGGHGGGDVASRIATEKIAAACRAGQTLEQAIHSAHVAMVNAARTGAGSPQMGTTVVALQSRGAKYQIVWAGDSRAYVWNGQLTQLSKDHSHVQQQIDAGKISGQQAFGHPERSRITRCLGPANPDALELATVTRHWKSGEKLLLCSDGLHGEVPQHVMANILASNPDNDSAVQKLRDIALESGGNDNVTVCLVSAPQQAVQAARAARRWGMVMGIVLLVIAAIAVLGIR